MNKNETQQPFHHSFLDSHKVFEFEERLRKYNCLPTILECLKKHYEDLSPRDLYNYFQGTAWYMEVEAY